MSKGRKIIATIDTANNQNYITIFDNNYDIVTSNTGVICIVEKVKTEYCELGEEIENLKK